TRGRKVTAPSLPGKAFDRRHQVVLARRSVAGAEQSPFLINQRPVGLVRKAVLFGDRAVLIITVRKRQVVPPDERQARFLLVLQPDAHECDTACPPPLVHTLPHGGVMVADGSPRRPEQ